MNTVEGAEKALFEESVKYVASRAMEILGWGKKKLKNAYEVERASSEYVRSYERRHGSVKVLGMTDPIPLRKIYTTVQLTTPENLRPLLSVEELQKSFEAKARCLGPAMGARVNAVTMANREQYLNIMGQPGAGKSTFLRRIGLEAFTPGKLTFLGIMNLGGLFKVDL